MNLAERQKLFLEAVRKHHGATKQTKIGTLFGVSNSAKIIEGGIQLGVANLDNANAGSDFFILACVLNFPPEDEVYFAVIIRRAKDKMLERLAAMKTLGAAAKAPSAAPTGGNRGRGRNPEGCRDHQRPSNTVPGTILSSFTSPRRMARFI